MGTRMKFLGVIIATLTYSQVNGQGHGDMGDSGGMGGSGGMGESGGMGGSGGMGESGDMEGMEEMEGECCPVKKVWGSMDPEMDGWYVNVGKKNPQYLPWRCNSPCIYTKKENMMGMQYCFADSMTSQSYCDAMDDDGEEPVDMGSGSGYGEGSEDPVDMGSGGSGMGSEDPVGMGSGSGSGGMSEH